MRSQSIYLTRLSITGGVTLSTPVVVLKEIADAHAISYYEENINDKKYLTQLINSINTTNVKAIKEPYDMKDYGAIARFVNKNYQWKKSVLLQAFDFLLSIPNNLTNIYLNFDYGPQTPDHPNSLNACALYAICKANKITTCGETTVNEMASNIKLLFSLKDTNINHSIRTTIHNALMYGDCEGYQLVNMLSIIDPEKSFNLMQTREHETTPILHLSGNSIRVNIDYDELRNVANQVRSRSSRNLPRTHTEAVAMAAIYYKMDISKVKNPLAEYQELTRTPYFPIDRDLAKRLQISNSYPDSLLSPRLDKNFNPELPYELYEDSDLNALCIDEGYANSDIIDEGSYTLLQTSYLYSTFLHGKQTVPINSETTMLDNYEELDYHNVLMYGIRNSEMRFYTYTELRDTFTTFKKFQKPDGNNETFPDKLINKLFVLCAKDQRIGESEAIFRERIDLGYEIDRVRLYLHNNNSKIRDFIYLFEMSDQNVQIKVRDFMMLLVESAMYMRGWSGDGSYPLTSMEANSDETDQPAIALRVTESIQKLDKSIEDLNEILGGLGNIVKELPLMFYNSRNGELTVSAVEEEGLTIYERINIVKGGENGSIQSCIRMSSNRFAASAYYYMKLMSMEAPFEISRMAHIQ